MRIRTVKIFVIIHLLFSTLFSQEITKTELGKIYKYELNNTAFPHELRDSGHVYNGHHYESDEHYKDQSTIIFIPNQLIINDTVNFVFYFHGWGNNIDTSIVRFNLLQQFANSNKNAILVLSETAKNASDSFGGKLEEKNVFADLVKELLDEVKEIYDNEISLGKITLSGHSGAYRVMSYILMHGGLTNKIEAVYIFDGLYADVEKYSYWLDNYKGKFINIYTPKGGTVAESENLILCLNGWGIPNLVIENDDFSVGELKLERIIFIKSELGHNEVVHTKNQFQKFLESSL